MWLCIFAFLIKYIHGEVSETGYLWSDSHELFVNENKEGNDFSLSKNPLLFHIKDLRDKLILIPDENAQKYPLYIIESNTSGRIRLRKGSECIKIKKKRFTEVKCSDPNIEIFKWINKDNIKEVKGYDLEKEASNEKKGNENNSIQSLLPERKEANEILKNIYSKADNTRDFQINSNIKEIPKKLHIEDSFGLKEGVFVDSSGRKFLIDPSDLPNRNLIARDQINDTYKGIMDTLPVESVNSAPEEHIDDLPSVNNSHHLENKYILDDNHIFGLPPFDKQASRDSDNNLSLSQGFSNREIIDRQLLCGIPIKNRMNEKLNMQEGQNSTLESSFSRNMNLSNKYRNPNINPDTNINTEDNIEKKKTDTKIEENEDIETKYLQFRKTLLDTCYKYPGFNECSILKNDIWRNKSVSNEYLGGKQKIEKKLPIICRKECLKNPSNGICYYRESPDGIYRPITVKKCERVNSSLEKLDDVRIFGDLMQAFE